MEKLCKECDMPLAVVLIEDGMDYHIVCAPEGEFQAWLDKYRELGEG
jgi:hypothetical protein